MKHTERIWYQNPDISLTFITIMEKVSIEFSPEELEKINKHRLENETLESTVRRLLLSHISEIPDDVWSAHTDSVFKEYKETSQKLAE